MDDATAIRLLTELGMDELSHKALPLLPLVQVAWADGEIQDRERRLILDLAENKWQVGEEGLLLLKNWLRYPPTEAYQKRGREALATIAARDNDLGFDDALLGDVLDLARTVAKSAGGLFGIGAISRSEAEALHAIAEALNVQGSAYDKSEGAVLSPAFEKPRQRVTITFSTSTLDIVAQGGVLEPDPELGGSRDKVPVDRTGVSIGSDSTAEVRIQFDPSVAAMHCRVFERNRKFYVQDLESETGTYVNGERVSERRLIGGEELRVGAEALFVFKLLRRIPKQMA
jgi:tellurite resistance protein